MKRYRTLFKASVEKDLKKLDRKKGENILKNIREKLALDPKIGLPLKGAGRELWRFRVGDYRVVYTFNDTELWVLVVQIAHKKEVYRSY